jgi:hypothetical protein
MNSTIPDRVAEQVKALPQELQLRVLEFARPGSLHPCGISGRQLLRFAGTISPQEAVLMQEAIEQGCERINADEW